MLFNNMLFSKLFLSLSFLCFSFCLNAQEIIPVPVIQFNKNEIALYHNWTHMGRDVEISFTHRMNSHGLKIGLNLFQNSPITDNQQHTYKNRFRAFNTKEKLGLNLEYNYEFEIPNSHVKLLPYLKIQYFNIGRQNIIGELIKNSEAQHLFNSTFGLEAKVKLYQFFYLRAAADSGIFFIRNPQSLSANSNSYDWEFSVNFRLGVSYEF